MKLFTKILICLLPLMMAFSACSTDTSNSGNNGSDNGSGSSNNGGSNNGSGNSDDNGSGNGSDSGSGNSEPLETVSVSFDEIKRLAYDLNDKSEISLKTCSFEFEQQATAGDLAYSGTFEIFNNRYFETKLDMYDTVTGEISNSYDSWNYFNSDYTMMYQMYAAENSESYANEVKNGSFLNTTMNYGFAVPSTYLCNVIGLGNGYGERNFVSATRTGNSYRVTTVYNDYSCFTHFSIDNSKCITSLTMHVGGTGYFYDVNYTSIVYGQRNNAPANIIKRFNDAVNDYCKVSQANWIKQLNNFEFIWNNEKQTYTYSTLNYQSNQTYYQKLKCDNGKFENEFVDVTNINSAPTTRFYEIVKNNDEYSLVTYNDGVKTTGATHKSKNGLNQYLCDFTPLNLLDYNDFTFSEEEQCYVNDDWVIYNEYQYVIGHAKDVKVRFAGNKFVGLEMDWLSTNEIVERTFSHTTVTFTDIDETTVTLPFAVDASTKILIWRPSYCEYSSVLDSLVEAFFYNNPQYHINYSIENVSEYNSASQMLTDKDAGADLYITTQEYTGRLMQNNCLSAVPSSYANDVKTRNVANSVYVCTFAGQIYAYPLDSENGIFMYYDNTVLSSSDVQNMTSMIQKAQSAGKKIAFNLSSAWYNASYFAGAQAYSDWQVNDAGNFISYYDNYYSDKGLIAMKGMAELIHSGAYIDSADVQYCFESRDACAVVSGTWYYDEARSALGDKLGIATLPTYTVNGQDYHLNTFEGCDLVCVKPQSDSQKEAILHELANYLTSQYAQTQMCDSVLFVPTNNVVRNSALSTANPAVVALLAQYEHSVIQSVFPGEWWTLAGDLAKSIENSSSITDSSLANLLNQYNNALIENWGENNMYNGPGPSV